MKIKIYQDTDGNCINSAETKTEFHSNIGNLLNTDCFFVSFLGKMIIWKELATQVPVLLVPPELLLPKGMSATRQDL